MEGLILNKIPENVQSIHLIAVCGTGMGALACMLKDLGYEITGSDQKVYPPMSEFLKRKGISLFSGYSSANIAHRPDLVIVGNAVSKDNPEVQALETQQLPFCSMPQAINHFIAAGKKPIVITGTHGKTTTASLMAWILQTAGLDPTFFIGGILKNFDSNYRLGQGEYIVLEGDEYDTAFFDKGAKFLHYHPYAAVLTSIEFDHADIFNDIQHIKRTFDRFLDGMAAQRLLMALDADAHIDELIRHRNCYTQRYGFNPHSDWSIGEVFLEPPWTRFEVFKAQQLMGVFRSHMIGKHNLSNALADIAIADSLGIPASIISQALESFQGIKRRQEVRGQKRGVTVIDDFAHHPTAVAATIKAVKPFYPDGRLIAVFEPRTNTSMRDVFQSVYVRSFAAADLICVRHPPMLEKIPPDQRFSSRQLVADLQQSGKTAHYFVDTDGIIDFLQKTARSGDVVLIMSNGGFDNIHHRLLDVL